MEGPAGRETTNLSDELTCTIYNYEKQNKNKVEGGESDNTGCDKKCLNDGTTKCRIILGHRSIGTTEFLWEERGMGNSDDLRSTALRNGVSIRTRRKRFAEGHV